MKSLTRVLSQSHLGVLFLLGFLLVLVTYLTVSEQFAFLRTSPTYITQSNPLGEDDKSSPNIENVTKDDTVKVHGETETKEALHETENTQPLGNERKDEDLIKKDGAEEGQIQKVPDPFNPQDSEKKDTTEFKQSGGGFENTNQAPKSKPICNTDNPYSNSETCDAGGDVRTHGLSSTVLIVPKNPTAGYETHEWKVRPYSRRRMESIKKITVKQLNSPQEAPPCSIKHDTPALVFALGGLIGNYWHDFTDVLVPLFIASRQFNGKVQFLVTNIQPWWLGKYIKIIKKLSHYEIINFDKDNQIRCFPRVLVGVEMHKEFSIDPSRSPKGYSMVDFTKFLRSAYHLNRDSPIRLSENPGIKPRLMIIHRGHYRKFTNTPEIAQLGEKLGFETIVIDPKFNVKLEDFAKTVNSFDVMLGVHGAGLTNCVFLPTNAIMIQVVPYGKLEHMAKMDFGDPARDMKLRYLEYSISAEESTLMGMFGKDHPIIKDPDSIHRSGWDKVAEFYLGKQDVRIDLNRFAPTLLTALEILRT